MADDRRALVLGGGGITGIAWELGLLAGLAAEGVDLADADLIVGTSAGSVVGAQLACGADVEKRYAAQLAPTAGEAAAALGPRTLLRLGLAMVGARDPQQARARIGRLALATPTVPEEDRLAVIGRRLVSHVWPERDLLITAVDAGTGEFRAFGRDAGIPLVAAVAASCAVPGIWPPVTAAGRRWIDGGIRSAANADLAAGYERVVVLAPLTRGIGPLTPVGTQVEALRTQSRVALVSPDAAARHAIGRNVLDPAHRAFSARAGRAQAKAAAAAVREVWTG
ncbi:patatin-like phospholipase family protein [Pseudonocardia bannensis]|uniref:Patatin-like phospholipase family protein n=1 Tax=Pseudonocardia bannensis TaxID=630973 RepID=A0A848DRR9_9PSEU|nr:patatin-like phospholipase family protein [Pseudonocardia bannensis]NMH95600.1 patatin-like phospholipase family protein [Pseudonocardia bannensis]